jgi:K+-transporting ATPase ATPase C chain
MKHFSPSFRFLLLMTVITGFIYPGLITVISQFIFPYQAEGSLVKNEQGKIIGSELVAQDFKGDQYFHPRPSAVDYNPTSSGASNLGPTSKDLLDKVNERKNQGGTEDLLFASGSGLDPHISPKSAIDQVFRVAQARHMNEKQIYDMVQANIEGRQFGFLGENRVNVLKLNHALDSTSNE